MKAKSLFLIFFVAFPFLTSCASFPSAPFMKNGKVEFDFSSANIQPKKKYVPALWHNLDAVTSITRRHYFRPSVDLKQCAGKETVQKIISAPNEQAMAVLLNGVLKKCLDRYSFYKTSIEAEREQDGQWLVGVGLALAEVHAASGQTSIIVSGVVPESPAEVAGFREGDVVLGVGDTLLSNADAVTHALAGNIGDPVTIAILRNEKMHLLIFVRRPFDVVPISAYLFPNAIAYVKLDEVSAGSAAWLQVALKKMSERQPSSLILDFRNNPGGAEIFSAACIVSLFTNDPMYRVVTLQNRLGEDAVWARECKNIFREWQWGEFAQFAANKKLVALVNEHTAFMAELIAADLQQLGAVVIGTKTHGNGSGHSVFNAKDDNGLIGELHLITDQVLAGEKKQQIEGIGVIPDIEISAVDYSEPLFLSDRVPNPDRDQQLRKALELMNAE
ncbi:PDZ domain-containing protein [Patescibacteria group bacterium]|nr:PDZ domain-containing protein [Patescibacteria group bacterium]